MKKLFFAAGLLFLIMFAPIVASASDISVVIDETRNVNFDGQPPAMVDSRVLVPIRGVFEALGFTPSWDGQNSQATLTRHDFTVVVTIGSRYFTTNGVTHALDVPAQNIGGRTLVPLRAILESMGYELGWEGATQTVSVYTPPFIIQRDAARLEALLRPAFIDGDSVNMAFDDLHSRYVIRGGQFEGIHPDLRNIFDEYFYYSNNERINANAFRDHLANNTGGRLEMRSPRFNIILRRDTDGGYYHITFNQMLQLGYTPQEAFQIFEYTIFSMTNMERANNNVPLLIWNDAIGRAARTHSQDMAENNMLSHTGSDGSNVGTRLGREGITGWSTWGENAYMSSGGATPASRVQGWMNSPGHRANILNTRFTHMGVGSYFTETSPGSWRGGHTQKFAAGGGLANDTPSLPR